MSATFERIRVEQDDAVAVVTLARAEKRNALDELMVDELYLALSLLDEDATTRVVLLRGDGPDFCAGADLSQLEKVAAGGDPVENLSDARRLGDLLVRIRRMRRPVIAAVHGHAWAGGAGLATACDLVLAAETASIAYPEVKLGFVPAMVMAILRRAVGEKVAFELIASGEPIDAARARQLGIVNQVHPDDGFADWALDYARTLASRSPSAIELSKRLLYGMDGLSFEEAIARGAEVNALARMTPDTRDGVRAFLEKKRKG